MQKLNEVRFIQTVGGVGWGGGGDCCRGGHRGGRGPGVGAGGAGDSSGWAIGIFDDAVDRGLHKGGEVVGLNGSLDLHGCNVPLAIGGVHWIAEKAGKEGWNELVIVTGNERAEGEGIRNNVIKELDEAGCEGFYTVDKNQNGKNKGRINVMGKSSIEKVSKSLMRKRSES